MRKKTKLLLEENNRLEEALSPESNALLTDMVVYLRGSRISTWEQEQVRRDLTQMLLDAEARGDKPEAVIGPDPKSLCDSIIEALPPTSRWKSFFSVLRDGLLSVTVLAAIWLVFGILEGVLGVGSWPNLTLTLGQLLSGVSILFIACGVVYWICRSSFSVNQNKRPWVLIYILLFALLCAGFFLRQPVATLPIPIAAFGVATLFIIYKLMDAQLD